MLATHCTYMCSWLTASGASSILFSSMLSNGLARSAGSEIISYGIPCRHDKPWFGEERRNCTSPQNKTFLSDKQVRTFTSSSTVSPGQEWVVGKWPPPMECFGRAATICFNNFWRISAFHPISRDSLSSRVLRWLLRGEGLMEMLRRRTKPVPASDCSALLRSHHVCNSPFPFAEIFVSLLLTQESIPPSFNRVAVASETWILFFIPVLSILLAVLTVSPNSWNLDFCPRSTPAVTGPLLIPIRSPASEQIYTMQSEKWVSVEEFLLGHSIKQFAVRT